MFIILFFIFILQGIWLFIAELAGKDLDTFLVIKFLLFYSPKVVPLVLPLSVLLASIMTFGNFAENYEFAAMKSSGISLGRAMRVLVVFVLLLSVVAFIFSNSIIPKAEYEFVNLRRSILQQKPSMAITEGQFSNMGNYNIKVSRKYGDEGKLLEDITIHRISNLGTGVNLVIKAERGELISNDDSNFLKLVLFDGNYYEDITTKNIHDRKRLPFAKSSFQRYVINFDLSPLEKSGDDAKITNTHSMLNVNELRYTLDSLQNNKAKEAQSFADNIHSRLSLVNMPNALSHVQKDTIIDDLTSILSNDNKSDIFEMARNNVMTVKYSIDNSKFDSEHKTKNINTHWHTLYEKFVIAYACLLMFFIGAPLGAIIKKGGVGLPIVFAVLIFIIFHFVNVFGKKIAQEDGLPPFAGAWMSSFILTPLAVFLTHRATNDKQITINLDGLITPFLYLFGKNKNKEQELKQEIVSLDSIEVKMEDADFASYSNMNNEQLVRLVKNSKQFDYTNSQRLKALKILETRGITQDELLLQGNLYNKDYFTISYYADLFKVQSKVVLLFYVLSLIFGTLIFEKSLVTIIIIWLACLILFYVSMYKTNQSLEEISKITQNKDFISVGVGFLLGFPFFFIMYLYNRKKLKEILTNYNA